MTIHPPRPAIRTTCPYCGVGCGILATRTGERAIVNALFLCAVLSVAVTVGIVAVLLVDTIAFFGDTSLAGFLTGTVWAPGQGAGEGGLYGMLPLLNGTLMIGVGSIVVALPLGLLTAIYLSEYAKPRVRKTIKPALELVDAARERVALELVERKERAEREGQRLYQAGQPAEAAAKFYEANGLFRSAELTTPPAPTPVAVAPRTPGPAAARSAKASSRCSSTPASPCGSSSRTSG